MNNGSSDRPGPGGGGDADWLRGHGYQWDVPHGGLSLQLGGQLPLPPMDQVGGQWGREDKASSRPPLHMAPCASGGSSGRGRAARSDSRSRGARGWAAPRGSSCSRRRACGPAACSRRRRA